LGRVRDRLWERERLGHIPQRGGIYYARFTRPESSIG
jgi:hypothetical protein